MTIPLIAQIIQRALQAPKSWIKALFPVAALCAFATVHAAPPPSSVSVPESMVTPVKVVKHTHRVVRKTTKHHTVHRKVTTTSSSSSSAKPARNAQ